MPDGGIDRGSGPPVVLIHGQPGEGADWAPLSDALAGRFRVLAPDRPGWGATGEPATDIAGNAAWLETLLARRLGDTPVIAVGHSFGGGVALSLAVAHPARVRALVLVGSIGHRAALTRLDHLLAQPAFGDPIVRAGTRALRATMRLARRLLAPEGLLARQGRGAAVLQRAERVSAVRVLAGEEPLPPEALRSFSIEQRALVRETAELEAALRTIAVPTVVVAGSRDLVVGVAAARALAEAVPGAELAILPGVGHLVPVEAPGRLADLVARYDRIAGATRAGRTGALRVRGAPPPPAGPAA